MNNMENLIVEYMSESIYTKKTTMCELFLRHGSDKSGWHNYTTFYNHIFTGFDLINKPVNFFELGIGTNNPNLKSNMWPNGRPGASLRAFSEYFPNGKIYGADIDKDIIFQTDRIKTFYCDQTNPVVIKNMWDQIPEDFDIIIDDGLHEAFANIIFFQNSYAKLKKGGIFIIEDVCNNDVAAITDFLRTVESDFAAMVKLPMDEHWNNGRINNHDNILGVIVK